MSRSYLSALAFGALLSAGCIPRPDYPARPMVQFQGIVAESNPTPFDTAAVVWIKFTDGDGDLGLDPTDIQGEFAEGQPYYYNLIVQYFEWKDGAFVERIMPDTLNMNSRFRRLTGNDGDGPLEGEMYISLIAFPANGVDSIKYGIHLIDRSLQRSDTVITPSIPYPF